MENQGDFRKAGEQHPDRKSHNDTLNFGWFSLPNSKPGFVSREDQLKSPAVAGGAPDNSASFENSQRPLSNEGHRPDSEQRTVSQQSKQYPPSSGYHCPDNQIPGPQHCMGEPDEDHQSRFKHQEQGLGQNSHNLPHDAIMEVEWPMSLIAQEHMVKQQYSWKLSSMPKTPEARSERYEVPPTPLPPLHWQGYQNCSRPTYSSWHDQWYQYNNHNSATSGSLGKDTNNSNRAQKKNSGKSRIKHSGKNTNTNNNMGEILTISVCALSQLNGSNYSADGNNNNWTIGGDNGSSAITQVRTIPPYERSEETIPIFYSPNVVMKWESTDDRSNSVLEKQSLKQISLLKRICSSLLQMWSILFCLKNKEDETAVHSSKLFKYDRFDFHDARG